MFEVHVSKHSLFRLKIMVGCLTSTYPCIHVETPSRSRSVACGAHIRAFTFLLTKTLSRSRSVVLRAHGVLCVVWVHEGVVVWWVVCCVVWCVAWWCCVVCGVWCEGVLFHFFFSILFFLFLALSPSFLFFPYSVLSSSFSSLFNSRQQTLCEALINKREHPSLLLSPPSSSSASNAQKKRGDFLLQEYFRRGIYFLFRF